MITVSDIIRVWPRPIDFARELGVSPSRITDWKNRNSIPAAYWRPIIRAAGKLGHPEITADLLADLHAREPHGGFAEGETAYEDAAGGRSVGQEPGRAGTGHFSRHKHVRRNNFKSAVEIEEHIRALREEWSDQ